MVAALDQAPPLGLDDGPDLEHSLAEWPARWLGVGVCDGAGCEDGGTKRREMKSIRWKRRAD